MPPLTRFFLHELRVYARHDLVEVLTFSGRLSVGDQGRAGVDAHKLNVLDAAGRGEMWRLGWTGGRGDGGGDGDVPLCDLGHQRRARSPARTHNAKSISIIVHVGPFIAGGPRWNKMKGATYHGSSLVASRTLASISLTLSTTFLAYRSPHKGRPSSSAITLGLA